MNTADYPILQAEHKANQRITLLVLTADYPILQAEHKRNSFSQQFHPQHNSFFIMVCL